MFCIICGIYAFTDHKDTYSVAEELGGGCCLPVNGMTRAEYTLVTCVETDLTQINITKRFREWYTMLFFGLLASLILKFGAIASTCL